MANPDKTKFLKAFIEQFEKEISDLRQSARSAHEAATHEESRAEDKHDTFAIEASYLAAGQATRIAELEKVLIEFKGHYDRASLPFSKISVGALVTYQSGNKKSRAFFTKSGGGSLLKFIDQEISVVTPESPLGNALVDAQVGDEIEVESKSGLRTYQVLSIE